MIKLGDQLIFVSRILPDGSGTEPVRNETTIKFLNREPFDVHCLSITKETYIACGCSSYVVKLKPPHGTAQGQQV
jgi:hypothetical protein